MFEWHSVLFVYLNHRWLPFIELNQWEMTLLIFLCLLQQKLVLSKLNKVFNICLDLDILLELPSLFQIGLCRLMNDLIHVSVVIGTRRCKLSESLLEFGWNLYWFLMLRLRRSFTRRSGRRQQLGVISFHFGFLIERRYKDLWLVYWGSFRLNCRPLNK
jgi:hypothetical protein